ncbi:hypothetical protein pb186bvf_007375 [Paramecium bursaria]
MFKFIEYLNLEAFEAILSYHPKVRPLSRIKANKINFICDEEHVNPIQLVKSEMLPYVENWELMHCSNTHIYLASKSKIQVFSIIGDTQLVKKLELSGVLGLATSQDCLFVTTLGQLLIYEIQRDFAQIGQFKFEIQYPFRYIRIMDESPKQLDYYEILLADDVANLTKVYCNVYKIFNARSVKFTEFPLLERGQLKQDKRNDAWWIQKSTEFKIVYVDKKTLYEILILEPEEKYANSFVLLQLEQFIDIYKISYGMKDQIQLIFRISNDNYVPGFACIGRGYIDSFKKLLCYSYGQIMHLYSYSIQQNNLQIVEEGMKILEDEYKITYLDSYDKNLFVVQLSNHFAFVHIQEFIFKIDKLTYLNEQYQIKLLYGKRLIALTQDSFEFLNLLDFDTFLNDYVKNLEFKRAMSNGIRIMRGELTILKLPLSKSDTLIQLTEFFKKLAFTYSIFLAKFEPEKMKEALREIISFLIFTENTSYLFTNIKDLLEAQEQLSLFEELVEEFILHHSIPYIPDQYLYDICQKYVQQDRVDMIQNLVSSLNLEQVETAILVRACDETNLDDDLIYICTVKRDYITPVAKLLGRQNITQKCYDYIICCVSGKTIYGDKLNDFEYIDCLKNLVQFLFIKENLERFLSLDKIQAFDIIYQLFQEKASKCLITNKNDIILKPENLELEIFQVNNSDLIIHQKIFLALKSISNDLWFAVFGCKLILQDYKFIKQITISLLCTLMDNFDQLKKHWINDQLNNIFIIRCLMKEEYDADQLELLLSHSHQIKQYTLVQVYIYSLQKKYGRAFEAFTKIENKQVLQLIFFWLSQLFQYQPMIYNSKNDEFIIDAVKFLLVIDPQKAYKFIEKHLSTKQDVILLALENTQYQQHFVDYLQHLFSNEKKLYLINDQTKILNLKYLCKNEPQKVLNTIKTIMFPLDEALLLTKEYNILEAAAYIYTITGAVQNALSIYTNLFLQFLKKCIQMLIKQQKLQKSDTNELDNRVQNLINFIIKCQEEDQNHQQLWFQFLDQFFKENKLRTFQDPKIPKPVKDLLCDYLSRLLVIMASYVEITYLFDQLQQNYGELPVQVFRQSINSIKNKCDNDMKTYDQLSRIFGNAQCDITEQLFQINQRGWEATYYCSRCHLEIIQGDNCIIFNCQHSFHDYCALTGYCKIPYCDFCNDETVYKIQVEKLLKKQQLFYQLGDQQMLKQMTMNNPPKKQPDRDPSQSNVSVLSAWFNLERALKDVSTDGDSMTYLTRPQTSKLFRDYQNFHSSKTLRPLTAFTAQQAFTRPQTALTSKRPSEQEKSSVQQNVRKILSRKVSARPHKKFGFDNIHVPPESEIQIDEEAIEMTTQIHTVDVDSIIDLYNSKCIDRKQNYNPEHALMFVEKFRKLCINEKIVLEDNLMSVESARSLYYILRNNNNFYSLNLSKNNLQDEGLKIITELMRDNTSICHLDISSNNITPQGAQEFFNELFNIHSIYSVDISCKDGLNRNKISVRGCEPLEIILKHNHPIQFLNLKGCQIQQTGFECIMAGLQVNSNLQYLNVSHNDLGPEAASYMATYLTNCFLTEIDLSFNPIGNSGMEYIARMFEKPNFQLKRIDLSGCEIKSLGIMRLFGGLSQNRFLESLTLDDNNFQGNGFNGIEQLLISRCPISYLSFSKCLISPEGADAIGNGLERNRYLRTLILRDNRIGDVGGQAIFKGLNFIKLDVKRCGITDKSCSALSQMIKVSQQLQSLCLADNDFHDASGIVICEAIRINQSVEMLDISENPINYKYVEELNKVIQNIRLIKEQNKIPEYEKEVQKLTQFSRQKYEVEKEEQKIKRAFFDLNDQLSKSKVDKEKVKNDQIQKTLDLESNMNDIIQKNRQMELDIRQMDQDNQSHLLKMDDQIQDMINEIAKNNQITIKLTQEIRISKDKKQQRKYQIDQKLESLKRMDQIEQKQYDRMLLEYKQLEDRIKMMKNQQQKKL